MVLPALHGNFALYKGLHVRRVYVLVLGSGAPAFPAACMNLSLTWCAASGMKWR